MSLSSTAQSLRPPTSPLTLEAVRVEIDQIDDDLLRLVERRQRLAARIGGLKPAGRAPLKLNPAREARVIGRLADRASPEVRALVVPLWRELMSAGLAAQQRIEVHVWSPFRRELFVAARDRFGASAACCEADCPGSALEAAARPGGVAVLALHPETPWWRELLRRPDLWVFEALGPRGAGDPAALAVGRIEPSALAGGVGYRVSTGGDSDPGGLPERLIAADQGRRLVARRSVFPAELSRELGWIGAAPV
jgi:chorismate mutase